MTEIKLGDEVWCWDAGSMPVRGVVTEVNVLSMRDVFRCHLHNEKISPDRVWCKHSVFLYQQETERMCGEMEDHADMLQRKAKQIMGEL